MVKKKNLKNSKKFQISNRLSYTIIAFVALVLAATIVYAANVNSGGTPSPGHSISQLGSPATCVAGQFLQWTGVTPDGGWACADISSSSSFWAEDIFGGITYSIGNVEVGRLARSVTYNYITSQTVGTAPAGHVTPCGATDTPLIHDCISGEYAVTSTSPAIAYDNYRSCNPKDTESCTSYYTTYTLSGSGYNVDYFPANLLVSGKIGVGTTGPTQPIDVVGNVKATGFCIGADCKTSWASVASSLAPSCYIGDRNYPIPDASYSQKKVWVTSSYEGLWQCNIGNAPVACGAGTPTSSSLWWETNVALTTYKCTSQTINDGAGGGSCPGTTEFCAVSATGCFKERTVSLGSPIFYCNA